MLTSAQQDLQASARRFLGTRSVSPPDWQQFAELGWLGVAVDEAHGGYGGAAEMALVAHELAVAGNAEPFLAAAVVPTVFLANAPRNPAFEGLLERVMIGEVRVVAAFESPGRYCDCPVRFEGGRLTGRYEHVLGGTGSQFVLLCASGLATHSRAVFLLDAAAVGVHAQVAPTIDSRVATVLTINAHATEWPGGRAAVEAFELAQDAGVLGQCAEMFGLLAHLFELTRNYLLDRRQFGQRLSDFQALRHRLADMYVELEQSRAMLAVAIKAISLPTRVRLLSACKIRMIRAARFIGAQAIQLHGAIALTQDYAVGRAYQRLLVLEKTWGDLEFHVRRFNAAAGEAND